MSFIFLKFSYQIDVTINIDYHNFRNAHHGVCHCSINVNNITAFRSGDKLWCCKTTKDACTIDRYKDLKKINGFVDSDLVRLVPSQVTCIGNAIPLTQPLPCS